MTDPTPVDQLGYREALAEVEAILDRLEHEEPDVDRVAADVARAAELVRHCKDRIASARLQVDEVVAGFAGPDGDAPSEAGPDGAPG